MRAGRGVEAAHASRWVRLVAETIWEALVTWSTAGYRSFACVSTWDIVDAVPYIWARQIFVSTLFADAESHRAHQLKIETSGVEGMKLKEWRMFVHT